MTRVTLPRLMCFAIVFVTVASCSSLLHGRRPRVDPNIPVPDSFLVRFETSKGTFDVMAHKQWAPIGVDRLYSLVGNGYFDDARFYRVVKDWVAQWGLAADPRVTAAWRPRAMADEPVKHTNARGTVSYARGGPGTRSTQLYINFKDNARLDTANTFGFPPIGEVVSGMNVVDSLYNGYGEGAPRGTGPSQDSIGRQGNAYLKRGWPKLDYIRRARVVREWR